MKPVGHSLGYAALITIFLPGLALALGGVQALRTEAARGKKPDVAWPAFIELNAWQQTIVGYVAGREQPTPVWPLFSELNEWQQIVAGIGIVALLGALIAAVNGPIERYLYPLIVGVVLKSRRANFVEKEVLGNSLDQQPPERLRLAENDLNTCTFRALVWFLFESRMALALLSLCVLCVMETSDRGMGVAVLFLLTLLSVALASQRYAELAEYRRELYRSTKRT